MKCPELLRALSPIRATQHTDQVYKLTLDMNLDQETRDQSSMAQPGTFVESPYPGLNDSETVFG